MALGQTRVDDCSPSRQLFNLQGKGSLPYAALLPAFFISFAVNYWHNKCGSPYNNANWWRQQRQPQSEPHSHTITLAKEIESWERAKEAHAKLLTLTCRNKREGSPQSKAKNMKLAYNFRRCRPFCFVHFTSRSPPTDGRVAKRNEMNETVSLPHAPKNFGVTAWDGTNTQEHMRTHTNTHRDTRARGYKSRKHQI